MTLSDDHRLTILLMLLLVVVGVPTLDSVIAVAAQEEGSRPVDLARVPVPPTDLPEPGFQFAYGGEMRLQDFLRSQRESRPLEDIPPVVEDHWRRAHTHLSLLFSNRASIASDWLASFATVVIELDSEDAAEEVAEWLTHSRTVGEDRTETIEGVSVSLHERIIHAVLVQDRYVIEIGYNPFDQPDLSHQANDWTAEAIAQLTRATSDRLQHAIRDSEAGENRLGIGALRVELPDAEWASPAAFNRVTRHYRVLDADVVPYPEEVGQLSADEVIPGVIDLFFARQGGNEGRSSHQINVTLARFANGSDAENFADRIDSYNIHGALDPGVTYRRSVEGEATGTLTHASLDLAHGRLSGYRSVRRTGEIVQVVEWLAGGTARVNESMVVWLANQQEACVRALPDPCAVITERDLPSAVDGRQGAIPAEAVTIDGIGNARPIGSPEYGWAVRVPAGDWPVTDREADIEGSDYLRLQSGRSIAEFETVHDGHGDPRQCGLDNLALLGALEERAVIDLGSDDEREAAAGAEAEHAWAIYTVEPLQDERADHEYTIRYDCCALPGAAASFVMTYTAPRGIWTSEAPKAARLRDGIRLPEAEIGPIAWGKGGYMVGAA